MKTRFVILLVFIFGICVIFCACEGNTTQEVTLLRIHVRANSNDAADQNVKLKVRDALNAYLTERLIGIDDFDDAILLVKNSLNDISAVADGTLRSNGFSYGAAAEVKKEYFPTRAYGEYVVESGTYDALIVNLGQAKGDNWWCVVYPPLCYLSESDGDVEYKSYIAEFIEKYFG